MAASSATAEHVLDVLLLFDETRAELTADEISDLIRAPRSTTYRYIRTLREKGLLQKTAQGGFALGPRVLQLARAFQNQNDLSRVALPIMKELRRETRETILLTRQFGRNAVCIEREEGPQIVRISFERGQIQPLHAGASSKILLAYLPEAQWDEHLILPLEAFTDNTITDPDQLKAQLRTIRAQGYCISTSEVDVGARAVAVPIGGEDESCIAALSVVGPSFRMSDEDVARYLDLLQTAATEIEQQLFHPAF